MKKKIFFWFFVLTFLLASTFIGMMSYGKYAVYKFTQIPGLKKTFLEDEKFLENSEMHDVQFCAFYFRFSARNFVFFYKIEDSIFWWSPFYNACYYAPLCWSPFADE